MVTRSLLGSLIYFLISQHSHFLTINYKWLKVQKPPPKFVFRKSNPHLPLNSCQTWKQTLKAGFLKFLIYITHKKSIFFVKLVAETMKGKKLPFTRIHHKSWDQHRTIRFKHNTCKNYLPFKATGSDAGQIRPQRLFLLELVT